MKKLLRKAEVGVVNGMAYTVFGGDILPIEVTMFPGKGELDFNWFFGRCYAGVLPDCF